GGGHCGDGGRGGRLIPAGPRFRLRLRRLPSVRESGDAVLLAPLLLRHRLRQGAAGDGDDLPAPADGPLLRRVWWRDAADRGPPARTPGDPLPPRTAAAALVPGVQPDGVCA